MHVTQSLPRARAEAPPKRTILNAETKTVWSAEEQALERGQKFPHGKPTARGHPERVTFDNVVRPEDLGADSQLRDQFQRLSSKW